MGRNKKNKPKKSRNYLRKAPLMFEAEQIYVPYDKGDIHGSAAEDKVTSILTKARIPSGSILKPLLERTDRGEVEISDGIIIAGGTAFVIQVKSRNKPIEELEFNSSEEKKIERLISKAYKQAKSSLDFIKQRTEMLFSDINGNSFMVRYSDYNWVALILINHPLLNDSNYYNNMTVDNDPSIRDIPRIVMSFQDLENMSASFGRIPYNVMRYLRGLQDQETHFLGNDTRYPDLAKKGLYDTPDHFLLVYESAIAGWVFSGDFPREWASDLVYLLDSMALSKDGVDLMDEFQKYYMRRTAALPKDFTYPENWMNYYSFITGIDKGTQMKGIGFGTLFYNSINLPVSPIPNIQTVSTELVNFSKRYMAEYKDLAVASIIVAIDVAKTNQQIPIACFTISDEY